MKLIDKSAKPRYPIATDVNVLSAFPWSHTVSFKTTGSEVGGGGFIAGSVIVSIAQNKYYKLHRAGITTARELSNT